MAAITGRMNGLWRRMAGVLILCALLLSKEVTCQEEETTAPPPVDPTTIASADAVPGSTDAPSGDVDSTIVPHIISAAPEQDNQADNAASDDSVTVTTDIKAALSPDVSSQEELNGTTKSGKSSLDSSSASSGSSVFVGILVSGLLAALAITIAYFKCQRRSEPKGVKLADKAFPVDQENQGNTLVSVAPLNPPPETQEKPNINGESTEPSKTEPPAPPPPTNGHSTAKTADTEL